MFYFNAMPLNCYFPLGLKQHGMHFAFICLNPRKQVLADRNYKKHMDPIKNNLSRFNTTTLEKLEIIKLLKRYDTKFLFHRDQLIPILDFLSRYYDILEIDNKRFFNYQNLYFDTDDYFFYHQHHNRKFSRHKVRFRRYVDTNQCYFEVKHKSNKRKTTKSRLLLGYKRISHELSGSSKDYARKIISINNGEIIDIVKPKLWIEFKRITFANQLKKERLTVDINLTFTNVNSHSLTLDDLVVVELKSENFSINSIFFQHLKSLGINPTRFSKYCIGTILTENDVKYNRFKKTLLKIDKLNQGDVE
jgi:hypothetical protein